MSQCKILVIDDEPIIVESIKDYFEIKLQTFDLEAFTDPLKARDYLVENPVDILIADFKMPSLSGLDLFIEAKRLQAYEFGILLTAFADKDLLQRFINKGLISQLLEKPLDLKRLESVVTEAYEQTKLSREKQAGIASLKQKYDELIGSDSTLEEKIIGLDSGLSKPYDKVRQIAGTNENVLLLGETGTGKNLVARLIHEMSERRDQPFVQVNCGAIPLNLIESELFGHKKGAFTGAVSDRKGKIALSNKGTLFLDEIAELTADMQIRLLHVVQEKTVEQLGSNVSESVDFRLICATNKDIENQMNQKLFRDDLYYRINTFPVILPPLRERRGDIPRFVEYMIEKFSREMGRKQVTISEEVVELLKNYAWPGNIRELENAVKRAMILLHPDSHSIHPDSFQYLTDQRNSVGDSLQQAVDVVCDDILEHQTPLKGIEKRILQTLIKRFDGNILETSKKSGIPKDRFYRITR